VYSLDISRAAGLAFTRPADVLAGDGPGSGDRAGPRGAADVDRSHRADAVIFCCLTGAERGRSDDVAAPPSELGLQAAGPADEAAPSRRQPSRPAGDLVIGHAPGLVFRSSINRNGGGK
jgi:hypothetical protein